MNRREHVLSEVADRVGAGGSKRRLPRAPWLVAVDGARTVDGVDGAGTIVFADQLAAVFETAGRTVLRVSIDDFHQPAEVRYRRGRTSPEGFYRDSYDYEAFLARVVVPLKPGGSRLVRTAAFDHVRDHAVNPKPVRVPDESVVLVDGIFLHRKKLFEMWDGSVFLRTTVETAVARVAGPDGASADLQDPDSRRAVEGQRLYLARRPERRATVVVDNDDPDAPFVVEVDGKAREGSARRRDAARA